MSTNIVYKVIFNGKLPGRHVVPNNKKKLFKPGDTFFLKSDDTDTIELFNQNRSFTVIQTSVKTAQKEVKKDVKTSPVKKPVPKVKEEVKKSISGQTE